MELHAVPLEDGQHAVLRHDPDLALPVVQRYHELGTVNVISVTGCLDRDGTVLALLHSRKLSQSPRRLGVGTMFEPLPPQPFTAAAINAVQRLLGSGPFELEVLVDEGTGEHLGPRPQPARRSDRSRSTSRSATTSPCSGTAR